jgi:hypothetical protein
VSAASGPAQRARESLGRLLDTTGTREKAQSARTAVGRTLTAFGIRHGLPLGDSLEDWQRFIKLSPEAHATQGGTPGRVAILAPYGLYSAAVRATCLTAEALKARGAEVAILSCDQALPACEATCILDYQDAEDFMSRVRPEPCEGCYGNIRDYCRVLGLIQLPLSSYSSPGLQQEAEAAAGQYADAPVSDIYRYERNGVAVGQIIEPALFRFYLRGKLPDDDTVRAVGRRFLRAGVELAGMLDRFIDEWQPDVLVIHAPVYLVGGTALAVTKARGVRSASWEIGYRRGAVMASHRGDYVREMRHDASASWDSPLTPQESQALDIYLDGRQRGAMDAQTHHPSPIEGREAVLAATGLQEGERMVSLFTNVVWDAQVYAEKTLFRGPVEWMIETLRHAVPSPGVRYVVRVHPAEVKIPSVLTQERMDDQIREAFPDLPDSVVVIPPEDDLSSYSLAAASDLAVTYSSTIGLETMAMGVPTAVAGYPFYAGKGFGIEPPDQETYYSIVRDPSLATMTPDEIERARRWAHYLFFRRMLILPDIVDARYVGLPRVRDLDDLLPGRYAGLDAFCNGIQYGSPFEAEDLTSLQAVLDGSMA